MKAAAIIAEYNPFHNGHQYQIEQTRTAGATHIVAVMGGHFLQRGEPALLSKWDRARSALLGGVDLVLELPLPYALATAERFAFGAVNLVESLGCVRLLSFGSECGDVSGILAGADAIANPAVYKAMRPMLDDGMSFAAARQQAIEEEYSPEIAGLFGNPNNILGIEYVRHLHLLESEILPVTVKRKGAGHHAQKATGSIASASYIRELVVRDRLRQVGQFLPLDTYEILVRAIQAGTAPVYISSLEQAVLGRLRGMSAHELMALPDVSEGLHNRLHMAIRSSGSLEEVFEKARSRRYPLSRIRRLVLSAFLDIPPDLCFQPPPYVRILGMNERGQEILSAMRESCRLPISASLAQLEKLDGSASSFAALEAKAGDLYALGMPQVLPCGMEYTTPLVKECNKNTGVSTLSI